MELLECSKKKKLSGISHGKPVRRTTPLKAYQPLNETKIRTDIESTKQKLFQLANKVKGYNQVEGFLNLLWEALGIGGKNNKDGGTPSRYAAFRLPDGSTRVITIRGSAHNTKCSTYKQNGNINGDENVSVVLQSKRRKNTFEPDESVVLEEYVYVNDRIVRIEDPLSKIAIDIANYLDKGFYKDSTGVAFAHYSPFNPALTQNVSTSSNGDSVPAVQKNHGADYVSESKNNKNKQDTNIKTENKNIVQLTESQFRQILVESISAVLNEEKGKKKVGDYTALDGQWMLMVYDGIENKGRVQDIRMYDNDLFRGKEIFDTILLFRRQDNLKFFYARIVPVGEHGVKFEAIPLKDVPKIIKDDFKTINPQGRVPYRVH